MTTWLQRWETTGIGPRVAVKDCIDVAGSVTTVGCRVIAGLAEPAAEDAAVVAAVRAAGAQLAGKTNLTELCWSAAGTNNWSGTPTNPKDPTRLPGGSSSGSAVAVATGEADVAFGTDTGGSVRVPAACCGVYGLKTTWGRVPRDGVYPLAPSLDTVGWLGKDLDSIELGMRLIEPGFTVPAKTTRNAGRLRFPGVATEIDAAVDAALAALTITEAGTIDAKEAVWAAGVIIDSEGYRSNEHLTPYADKLEPHNQLNLRGGAAYTDEDIAAAHQTAAGFRRTIDDLLSEHGFLVLPVLVGPPPLLGQRGIPLTRLTALFNLTGHPALAIPLPGASLQVVGPANGEEELIAFARGTMAL
ncbi:MAG: amidase [Streptosporangiaceae bacterium]|jgi:amidase